MPVIPSFSWGFRRNMPVIPPFWVFWEEYARYSFLLWVFGRNMPVIPSCFHGFGRNMPVIPSFPHGFGRNMPVIPSFLSLLIPGYASQTLRFIPGLCLPDTRFTVGLASLPSPVSLLGKPPSLHPWGICHPPTTGYMPLLPTISRCTLPGTHP